MVFDLCLNIVFNVFLVHILQRFKMNNDRQIIQDLGGPAKVAEMLGYDKSGGTQRVSNWLSRGIPSKVKLQHPDIFLKNFKHLDAA